MKYEEFIQSILNTRGRFACGEEYHEKHHILPHSMGGTDGTNNLIDLYAREHFIAHKLLAEENKDNDKLIYAWWAMAHWENPETQERYRLTSEEYEYIKKEFSNMMSVRMSGENSYFYGKDVRGEKNPHYGIPHTEETKKLLSKMAMGREVSQETRDKISKSLKLLKRTPWNKNKRISPEHKQKISNTLKNSESFQKKKKKIFQFDLDGNFIKEWNSISEASSILNISNGHISQCCNNKRKQAGGYMWKFIENGENIQKYRKENSKKVGKYNKDTNELIEIFDSLGDAARSVNSKTSNIVVCCSDKYTNKTCKGFIWKYIE